MFPFVLRHFLSPSPFLHQKPIVGSLNTWLYIDIKASKQVSLNENDCVREIFKTIDLKSEMFKKSRTHSLELPVMNRDGLTHIDVMFNFNVTEES